MNKPEVLIRVEGKAGRITLNRPEALNALNHAMVVQIEKALLDWQDDPAVQMVIVDGEGDKAFCAGGDINAIYQSGREGDFSAAPFFWKDEYRLNAYIARYPKPYIALMHGFVMGGGVGLSAHGSHRIVTEKSMVAMPECSIGLIPDVGGTHLLGKAPGRLGEFAGLTGFRLNAADAILLDFADIYIASESLPMLVNALTISGDVQTLEEFAKTPTQGLLKSLQDEIDRIFSRNEIGDIIQALEEMEAEWAQRALKDMKRAAPLSLLCTLSMIRSARAGDNLEMALETELRFTTRSSEHGEFLEGIRAAVIDKDRNPSWLYPTLESVPNKLIDFMLSPL